MGYLLALGMAVIAWFVAHVGVGLGEAVKAMAHQ